MNYHLRPIEKKKKKKRHNGDLHLKNKNRSPEDNKVETKLGRQIKKRVSHNFMYHYNLYSIPKEIKNPKLYKSWSN